MRIFFIISLFLFLTAACTKTDDDAPAGPLDELPPATQTGANTFGCLINGEPWYNRGGQFNDPDVSAGYGNNFLSVYGRAIDPFISDKYDRINITFHNPSVGNSSPIPGWNLPFRLTYEDYVFYRLDTLSRITQSLTRFDLDMQIASGTFAFTAINDELMDTLVVTDGRFDVEFVR